MLYGIDSPCFVPDEHIANIEMYFPTNTIVELWKSQGDVDRSLIEKGDGSTAATILVDRPLASMAVVRLPERLAVVTEQNARSRRGARRG